MMWFWLALYFALWSSIATLIVKKLTKTLHPATYFLAGNLLVIPLAFMVVLIFWGIPKITTQFYLNLTFSSALDVVAFFASIWAIKISPISLVTPMSSFNPVFTTVIAALTLGEIPTITKLSGVVLIVIGAYLLNVSDIKKGLFVPVKNLLSNRGIQLSLLAYFLWAITPIFQKQAIFETQPTTPLFASLVGLILTTIFALPFSLRKTIGEVRIVRENIKWFVLPLPFHVVAFWAGFTAFSLTNVSYVTAIFKLSVLFTILWGGLFFKETNIKERLLGGGVMLAGTILLVS